jgi:peptidoglycan/LPS O-acetylase OafA/YrhL
MGFRSIEHHVPLSFLYTFSLFLAAYLVASFVLRVRLVAVTTSRDVRQSRFGAIDSLRGLLALGVVVHHTLAAAAFFDSGAWGYSTNLFMNNLGRVGVGMFFMITGFLFTVKASELSIDWPRFFRHRLLRLFPLYAVVVLLIHFIIFTLCGWQLKTTVVEALVNAMDWLAFVIRRRPDINGYSNTEWIIAGVNWTLKYEVFFYIVATPLLHAGFRWLGRSAMAWVAVALCALLYVANQLHVPNAHHFLNLFLGVLCAFIVPLLKPNICLMKVLASIAICSLFITEEPLVIFLANATIFLFMANLEQPERVASGALMAPLQWLGEISYSIYLLHGMVLYLCYVIFGVAMSMAAFWGLAIAVVVFVVLVSSLTYKYIERPCMTWGR